MELLTMDNKLKLFLNNLFDLIIQFYIELKQ